MAKKDKSRQKKFDTRIDFTPMVDMNMLLITFFMLCTTMLKSKTLDLMLPTLQEEATKEEETKIKQSDAITFIIDGQVTNENGDDVVKKGVVYYYTGQPDMENYTLKEIQFGNEKDAIRGMLQDRNKELLKVVNKYKDEWKNGTINDSVYNAKVKEAQAKQAKDKDAHRPIVSIKPTATASYADVIRILDEMEYNRISTFQIESFNKEDSILYQRNIGPVPTAKKRAK